MIVTLKDGATVQIVASGNSGAPDNQGGQHCNRSTVWFRLGKCPYEKAAINLHRVIDAAEMADDEAEFRELLTLL